MKASVARMGWIVVCSLGLLLACQGSEPAVTEKTVDASIRAVPDAAWEALAEKKIFFGHQSVGYNILEGVGKIVEAYPRIRLNIVESVDPTAMDRPGLTHGKVGMNSDPASKCRAFAGIMESGIGGKADIAFFKFCYVDIKPDTDIRKMFAVYLDTITGLAREFPRTVFVHCTVPLTTQQTGPRAWIKKLLGKPVRGVEDNLLRERFNTLLRNEYAGKEPLFDLARLESTDPAGRRISSRKDGATYYRLVPAYTRDGGHLNGLGQEVVGGGLLLFLAELAEPSGPDA